MGRTEHRSGGFAVVVNVRTPDTTAGRKAAREVTADEVARVVRAGASRWPVKTGRSRAAFDVGRTDDGANVSNPVVYAGSVRLRDGRLAWVALVVEPLQKAAPEIGKAAAEAYLEAALGV